MYPRDDEVYHGDNMPYNAVAVAADVDAHQILPASLTRRRVTLINNGATGSVCYIGSDNGVDNTNGFPLASATVCLLPGDGDPYAKLPAYVLVLYTQDAIWGFVGAGGVQADIRYLEEID